MSFVTRIFRSDRDCLLLIVPLALLLFTTNLGGRDLWAPDEPRAGTITRHIVEQDKWLVLYDNGRAYVEKPPLFYWLAALFSLPAGQVSEYAVRMPSNLAAILCVVCLFYLGRDLHGRRVGALAAVVLATSQDFFLEARWAHPDMLLCLMLTFSCLAFHRGLVMRAGRMWLFGGYAAIGLAILTKGPVGLLPLGGMIVFLAATRQLGALLRAGLAWGAVVMLLPTALWLTAYGASAGAGFPLGEALARIGTRVTTGVHHAKPFWHMLVALPGAFFPWCLFLPGALWHSFPRRPLRDQRTVYLYSFLVLYLVVFAVSAEKRAVYLLPLMPLMALLVGRVWDTALFDWEPSPVERTLKWGLVTALLVALGATLVLWIRIDALVGYLQGPATLLGAVLLLGSVIAVGVRRRLGGGVALGVYAAGLVACYMVIATIVMPAVDQGKSARPFSERIAARVGGVPLGICPDYHAAYAYYTRRRLVVLPDATAVAEFLVSAPRTFSLVEEDHYQAERARLENISEIVDRAKVGHRTFVLLAGGSDRARNERP